MKKDLSRLRHSCSHILAYAVMQLYPNVKFGIGPSIEEGFYYDFGNLSIEDNDLVRIERKMQEIIDKNYKFEKKLSTKKEAEKILKNQPFKLELLKELKDKKISFYKTNEFIDLCKGPHIKSTKEIKAFKLLNIAGAYWRGDSNNAMLKRIYGTAFFSKEELNEFLRLREEALKRDHRLLGKKLELFSFHEESPGNVFWHQNGMFVYNKLLDYEKNVLEKNGYKLISTPIILDKQLWLRSGHWDHYKDDMYFLNVGNREFAIKPMNCPGAILIYKDRIHSYKEFPLRLAEFGLVHRNELSGVLSGLFRVRQFTQDDAHIFCSNDQIKEEVNNLIKIILGVYKEFGFKDYHVELSTRPKKYIGSLKNWKLAEASLKSALNSNRIKYKLNKEEGAFYGPKIDFYIRDSLNRSWQCGTIQVDFAMPERFKLSYEGKDSKKHIPVIIHRTLFGSIERFVGILLEHYSGKLPLWLSPIQVVLLTVTSKNEKYTNDVYEELKKNSIRVETDYRQETISRKVRDAQVKYINYIITIGDKEEIKKTLAIRTLDGKIKFDVKLDEFIKEIKND